MRASGIPIRWHAFLAYICFVLKSIKMTALLKQYRKEIRNILVLALLVAFIPYLPQIFRFVLTFTGLMLTMGLLCAFVLGLSLKLHYRIMVMRIMQENKI